MQIQLMKIPVAQLPETRPKFLVGLMLDSTHLYLCMRALNASPSFQLVVKLSTWTCGYP